MGWDCGGRLEGRCVEVHRKGSESREDIGKDAVTVVLNYFIVSYSTVLFSTLT